jgi:hypothetical protein
MWDKKPEDYITKKEFMDYFEEVSAGVKDENYFI